MTVDDNFGIIAAPSTCSQPINDSLTAQIRVTGVGGLLEDSEPRLDSQQSQIVWDYMMNPMTAHADHIFTTLPALNPILYRNSFDSKRFTVFPESFIFGLNMELKMKMSIGHGWSLLF